MHQLAFDFTRAEQLTMFQLKLLTFIEKAGNTGVRKSDIGRKFVDLYNWSKTTIYDPASYVGGGLISHSYKKGYLTKQKVKGGSEIITLSEYGKEVLKNFRATFCTCE